ncbi:MAG: nucleotidyl transferase AbiEii/AbiGii toxin family protein [bacterium]|nr:nucleotidyl transferase AbiEii/AbiGii toxin family protein [bacterium]
MFTTVLSPDAQNALAILGKEKCLPENTFLAGGSSLALQFGHRISVDFDFFTPSHFVGKEIIKKLKEAGTFELQEAAEKNTLLGLFNSVKFSLFLYEYPLIDLSILWNGVNLASPLDISAMKLAAVMDRGTKKDFIDLYILNKNGITIDKSFEIYEEKYKSLSNNLYSLIKSLSYFDDAERLEMPQMIEKISWDEVKKFFESEVIRLSDKYLK